MIESPSLVFYSDLKLQSIVPFTQLRYKNSWVHKIFNQYKKISSDVQVIPDPAKLIQQMQYNFLLICWNLTVYGSAFFNAAQAGKVCTHFFYCTVNDLPTCQRPRCQAFLYTSIPRYIILEFLDILCQ